MLLNIVWFIIGFVFPLILGWIMMDYNNYSFSGILMGIVLAVAGMAVPLSCIGKDK